MLNGLGYTVVEAASAEQALTLVQEGLSPDLVVSDHLMPGMNGADLAQAILSERPSIQVLIISGYAENDGISPGLPRLNKPFRYDELAACLARLQIDRVSHFGEPKWPEGLARTAPEWEVGGS
nr:response regulator [Reyranella sp.]